HTRSYGDWSSDVCSSDLEIGFAHGTDTIGDSGRSNGAPYVTASRNSPDGGAVGCHASVRSSGLPAALPRPASTKNDTNFRTIFRSEERRVGKECRLRLAE